MGDHLPQRIHGGTLNIPFLNGERVNGTNRYSGWIFGDGNKKICATFFLDNANEDLRYRYNFALENKSPYVLKVFGKYDYHYHDSEDESVILVGEDQRAILVTELVDDTLETWANNNLLLEPKYPERLTLPFMGILLDILHGIIHFHLKFKRLHGEICSQNIYIVDGKAKLAHVKDPRIYRQQSFEDDINKFCAMVQQLLNKNNLHTPLELAQFFNSMRLYKQNKGYLRNSVNHPIFLTPKERAEMRHLAHSSIRESSRSFRVGQALLIELKNAMRKFDAIQGPYWIGNVREPEFLNTLTFRPLPYHDLPLDFIQYCRNVGEHVRGDWRKPWLTDEYRDELLTSFLPGFLPILHDVLTLEGIYVRTLPAIR